MSEQRQWPQHEYSQGLQALRRRQGLLQIVSLFSQRGHRGPHLSLEGTAPHRLACALDSGETLRKVEQHVRPLPQVLDALGVAQCRQGGEQEACRLSSLRWALAACFQSQQVRLPLQTQTETSSREPLGRTTCRHQRQT